MKTPISIATLLVAAPLARAADSPRAARPNILLIISDDQGYGDATGHWKTDLQTPVMDAIGKAGVRFAEIYRDLKSRHLEWLRALAI